MNIVRARGRCLPVLGAVVSGLVACGGGARSSGDAAVDLIAIDLPVTSDSAPVPLTLDFSATGCAAFDPAFPTDPTADAAATSPRCTGVAPLTLAFTPVASIELTRFLWTFGDDTPDSSDRSPTHTYALPGKYRVTLVGLVPGIGSLQQNHADYVVVSNAPVGAPCDVNEQCADGAMCWCGSTSPCAPALARGVCSMPCSASGGAADVAVDAGADAAPVGATGCPLNNSCVDLSISPSSSVPQTIPTTNTDWRRALCLQSCSDDSGCALGLRCRDLPSADGKGAWTRACFGGYPFSIGARCGDADSRLVDADCASQQCADFGAFGHCSADCSQGACPVGTGCAYLGDGRRLCLATCSGTTGGGMNDAASGEAPTPCDDDPLMVCQAPGGSGPLGFTLPGGTPGATYCSPKRCTTSDECAPSGVCPPGGGSCTRLGTGL